MPDFFNNEQDKYQEDPMVAVEKHLRDIKEYMHRLVEDVNRIREDVDKMDRKMK
jgi:hypothetical protein